MGHSEKSKRNYFRSFGLNSSFVRRLTSVALDINMHEIENEINAQVLIQFFLDQKRIEEFDLYLVRKHFICASFYVNRYIFIED